MAITKGATIGGTLTVDNLVVTGSLHCNGDASFDKNIGTKTLTSSSTITADNDIRTKGTFYSVAENICFHWGQSPEHRLYVHGGGQGLGGGDAFIQTVN